MPIPATATREEVRGGLNTYFSNRTREEEIRSGLDSNSRIRTEGRKVNSHLNTDFSDCVDKRSDYIWQRLVLASSCPSIESFRHR